MITFGLVGIHVPAGMGMHGCGVSTPSAAAVAAATAGLARDVHIPKGPILAPPCESVMVAAGLPCAITLVCEVTLTGAGAVPIVHIAVPPAATSSLMILRFLSGIR